MESSEILKQNSMEKMAMNMAEGLIDELEKEGKSKKKGKETTQSRVSLKGFQLYTGMILTLGGAALSNGRATGVVLFLTALLLCLEICEVSFIPEKKKFSAQMVFSGSILLIGILQIVETIGKNFSFNVFYLLLTLLGGLLMFLEVVAGGNLKQGKS
ncbi:MAG: hypothetical protein ACYDBV_01200 [Nitrospiria bacterium]